MLTAGMSLFRSVPAAAAVTVTVWRLTARGMGTWGIGGMTRRTETQRGTRTAPWAMRQPGCRDGWLRRRRGGGKLLQPGWNDRRPRPNLFAGGVMMTIRWYCRGCRMSGRLRGRRLYDGRRGCEKSVRIGEIARKIRLIGTIKYGRRLQCARFRAFGERSLPSGLLAGLGNLSSEQYQHPGRIFTN